MGKSMIMSIEVFGLQKGRRAIKQGEGNTTRQKKINARRLILIIKGNFLIRSF